MRPALRIGIVSVVSLIWFSLVQTWGAFSDPDIFYHAKLASLMMAHGPLHAFPWLDLTSLGRHFADLYFLFHALLVPFVWAFGTFQGTQVAAVVLASAFIVTTYLTLRALRVSQPEFWTFVLISAPPLLFRLTLGKATPLVLIYFVIGMYAQARGKRLLGFAMGLLFALSHGGWSILLGCQALFIAGTSLFSHGIEHMGWKAAARASRPGVFIATAIGALFGTLIHPNFPQNIILLWIQVVKIGLLTPAGRVDLGVEWEPISTAALICHIVPIILLFFVLMFGMMFARHPKLDLERARDTLGFAVPFTILVVFTLKSQRMFEYLIPMVILFGASLMSLIDTAQLKRELYDTCKQLFGRYTNLVCLLCISAVATVLVHDVLQVRSDLAYDVTPFDRYVAPMQAIETVAKPGDRIFHSQWDQFPPLFAQGDRFRYVSGLDPTFLLESEPALSDTYRDIIHGHVTSSLYTLIHDRFGSSVVFIDRIRYKEFEAAMEAEPRAFRTYQDPTFVVYALH